MSRNLAASVKLPISVFWVASKLVPRLTCRRCRSRLDVHQPDPIHPDQFLGTCSHCGRWYRVEEHPSQGKALVIQLPGLAEVVEVTNPPDSDA